MFTVAARPVTVAPPLLPAAVIASLPPVPLTITLSAAPSFAPRSTFTVVTPVPVRSFSVTVSAPPSVLRSTCSTPFVSIVMFATSRKSLNRLPFADRSMCSLTLAPLNSIVSVPVWPSTVSLPSPGFQTNVSSPAPRKATSLPLPPLTRSLPAEPSWTSASSPPLLTSLIADRVEARGVDRVGARERVDRERVVRGLGCR